MTTHKGFEILQNDCIQESEKLIQEALSSGRKRKMVQIFDDLSDSLCKLADMAEFIRIAHPKLEYCKAAESACSAVSSVVEELNTNVELYKALEKAVYVGDVEPCSEVDKTVGELFLFDFQQCGIHLPETERNKIVKLNDTILNLGQHFVSGSNTARVVDKKVLPNGLKHM